MPLQGSDLFAISRAGTNYSLAGSEILAFVQANVGTSEYTVADIAARNALAGLSIGDRVMVNDATGDATVGAGWAIYVWMALNTWRKMAEQEGLDVVVGGADLTYTAGAGSGIVASSSGTDATIPAATATEAGLMLPAQFTKMGFITVGGAINLDTVKTKTDFLTVTAATNLDTIRGASHVAVTTAGTANNNPIVVAGQVLSFSIANLTTAP